MINYQGTALITGASSGIGEAFARELATRGMNVVLVARSQEKLMALASDLSSNNGIRADAICIDLSESDGAESLFRETEARGIDVTMLVNNAGFATYGPLETLELLREQQQIMLNIHAVVSVVSQIEGSLVNLFEGWTAA